MANVFGTDILIQAKDPTRAALFYAKHLGFEITEEKPNMISLHGEHINFFIERGPALGPVLEVTVDHLEEPSGGYLSTAVRSSSTSRIFRDVTSRIRSA